MNTIQIGDVVGNYKVIAIAGAGGMGTVYKIEHVITRRIEAMKLLPPGLGSDPEQARRFEREIQLHARLDHPNIVALYNAVRDAGSTALIMEFVEGQSLQRRMEAGPLPVETAVNFAAQVLGALAYAHQRGVIHRDVSPGNIIITPDLVAKLSDFGLALGSKDPRLSASGVPLGSPAYMSPEQIKGSHELDARTDLYAMGAVLHEMLTGRKLFEAEEGAFALMRAHVESEPPLPSSVNPEIPASLDRIVSKAVAKDPAMRFTSADEFRTALQHFATDTTGMPTLVSPHRKLRNVRFGREAMLLALAPIILTGFYAVRLLPSAARGLFMESHSQPSAAVAEVAQPGQTALPVATEEPRPVLAKSVEMPQRDATPNPPNAVPRKSGNRFLQALGKVNPFRRWMKRDASKARASQD